ncbi:hypothetical protein Poly30_56020 [Planctomycetes bacterium Poly30]|uniref:Uncharacterized protein n=1 Tax=Saltatorellus ferox TaxID=2528018 RepID=A0A518F117_9BACT|nr:hypothetical protein Poly30_56020 [Planctomycetes bacterium Poly30]
MKVTLLSLALICGACQSTDAGSSRSIHPSPVLAAPVVEAPASALETAPEVAKLPRRVHLDRSEYAVRDWVRDRS